MIILYYCDNGYLNANNISKQRICMPIRLVFWRQIQYIFKRWILLMGCNKWKSLGLWRHTLYRPIHAWPWRLTCWPPNDLNSISKPIQLFSTSVITILRIFISHFSCISRSSKLLVLYIFGYKRTTATELSFVTLCRLQGFCVQQVYSSISPW